MATHRSTPWGNEHGSGLVAATGSAVGATLVVLVLFAVLYTTTPPWIEGWVAVCGIGLIASSVLAWQWPSHQKVASRLGLVASTVGLALALPTLGIWSYSAITSQPVAPPDLLAFAAGTSIVCACYLSLLAAHFIRHERLAAEERRAFQAARASTVALHAASLRGWVAPWHPEGPPLETDPPSTRPRPWPASPAGHWME